MLLSVAFNNGLKHNPVDRQVDRPDRYRGGRWGPFGTAGHAVALYDTVLA